MRSVGYRNSLPIDDPSALMDIELPKPTPTGRDLLVEVRAVSVNPVDTRMRAGFTPEAGQWNVLGWDAAGVVEEAGPLASLFKPGDEVFYAGALRRPGANAEFHLVDERIVGRKPRSLSWAEASALALTALTAWEALFDRLDVKKPAPSVSPSILITGGGGNVGSMAVQLARKLTDLTIIATASRPETQARAREMGAHHVIDHSKSLAAQVNALGVGAPGMVFSVSNTDQHLSEILELVAPQGRIAVADDPATLDIKFFKHKSISVHWVAMFTRSTFETADIQAQHALLNEVARLVDDGVIRTTLTETLGSINAANLRRAHQLVESGRLRGKIALEGFR
ncbi:zinc-binding alcohol dehydrogenase family protein [Phenylobacterium sp.]|jgi:NADPH2:quinone reductase|uniref:zinc-binding alcohol dehydrogenase family protein n=1 Tax=Phenylobacterium sp. TaxID=1871053 RepID=UPI002F41BE7C